MTAYGFKTIANIAHIYFVVETRSRIQDRYKICTVLPQRHFSNKPIMATTETGEYYPFETAMVLDWQAEIVRDNIGK